jgi:hypothetical protein
MKAVNSGRICRLKDFRVVWQTAVRPDSIKTPAFTSLRAGSINRVRDGINECGQGEQGTEPEEGGCRRLLRRPTDLSREQ